jgi:hypothetical protein
MAFTFDDEDKNEYQEDDTQDESQNISQEQEAAVEEFVQEDERLDSQLSEVEKRLEKAQFYRALLTQDIFGVDNSEAAQAITTELRTFIRSRLAVLLGVVQDVPVQAKVQAQFDEDEAKILKQVARKLLKKPTLMEEKKEPTIRKTEPPKAPKVTLSQPKPQVKPMVAKPALKPGPKPNKPQPTDEFITIDKVKYRKHIDKKHGEIYLDRNNKKYRIGVNGEGLSFMQTLSVQSEPVGPIKRFAPLTPNQTEIVSRQHASEVLRNMDVTTASAIGKTQQ